jgi:glycosyltransferase involved in cell wall biosynthesis
MTEPLVSVVVPVYNGARFLRESLDSILRQTYPRTEVIVLDDASKDETPSIIASYGDRIRSVRNERNRGGFGNMNAGIALATGDLVAIYHADDVYEPTIVEREVSFLNAHPDIGTVFCLDVFIDATGHEYGRVMLPPELERKDVLAYPDVLNALLRWKNRFLRAPGAMLRRSTYGAIGVFREEFGIAADLDLWLRAARHSGIGMLHEYLYRYRHFHGNWSQQHQYLRTEADTFFTVMDHWLASGERPHASPRAQEYLMNAVALYIKGEMTRARQAVNAVRWRTILAASTIQRARMLVLLGVLRALCRLPRIGPVSDALHARWYPHGSGTIA